MHPKCTQEPPSGTKGTDVLTHARKGINLHDAPGVRIVMRRRSVPNLLNVSDVTSVYNVVCVRT